MKTKAKLLVQVPILSLRFYAPDRRLLTPAEMLPLIYRAPLELTFESNTTHMVYSVDKALAIVRAKPRAWMELPTTYSFDEQLDPERVSRAIPTRPGIVYGYRDADGKPLFDLADGNHRYRRAVELGFPFFPVYPLTVSEIKSCEMFYTIEDGSLPMPIVYREVEDE